MSLALVVFVPFAMALVVSAVFTVSTVSTVSELRPSVC